jgi:hypothetical protein
MIIMGFAMDRQRQLYRLLDHELRVQAGSSLEDWCAERGVDAEQTIADALSGSQHEMLAELAAEVGVSVPSLAALAA